MDAVWSRLRRTQLTVKFMAAVARAQEHRNEIEPGLADALDGITVDQELLAAVDARDAVIHHDHAALVDVLEGLIDAPCSRFLQFGLTTNDSLDTVTGLQLNESCSVLANAIEDLLAEIEVQARRHIHALMIGRSHGVHGEPITFGLKLANWYNMLYRAHRHLDFVWCECAQGHCSGAMGTFATVHPEVQQVACEYMDIDEALISTQVISRDRHAMFAAVLTQIAGVIEHIALQVRLMAQTELGEIIEWFAVDAKGSSAMPHKRNPWRCENLCGLARLVRGWNQAIQESVALWHERDISHSSVERIALVDMCHATHMMLTRMLKIMQNWRVNPERMLTNIEMTRGQVYSQKLMLALIKSGMGRDQAYRLIQPLCHQVHEQPEANLRELAHVNGEISSRLGAEGIDEIFNPTSYVTHAEAVLNRVLAEAGDDIDRLVIEEK